MLGFGPANHPAEDDTTCIVIDSTVVTAGRAYSSTPVAHVTLGREALSRETVAGNSLPMTLGLQPSVVAASEGGTGLGYSSLRIRGVPGNQTVVSLNGIPLNDAESQEVFWVNIPAIGSYLSSAQIQRGLGTSVSGPGAFGASLDMNTAHSLVTTGGAALSGGSFGTFTAGGHFSSGLSGKGLFAEAALNFQRTDGYIRNAFARVGSVYASGGWQGLKDLLKLTLLHGQQRSGITWEGIPLEQYNAGNYTYNPAGEYVDADGRVCYYDNQTDNYRQTHIQLLYSHDFAGGFHWKTTLNCTRGYGYYEQYKVDFLPSGDAITQDALDNTLWAARSEVSWSSDRLKATGGIYLSSYGGAHWGEFVEPSPGERYYENDALKREMDLWLRAEWSPSEPLNLYADLQYRTVTHRMAGPDEYDQTLAYDTSWNFFNPRVGANLMLGRAVNIYLSAALGHKEPGRSDIQARADVQPETMVDVELGAGFAFGRWKSSAGLFAMEYFDMLAETGRLNDAGYAVKDNVPRAWRRGLELASSYEARLFSVEGNITLSTNKLETSGERFDLRLSPSVTAAMVWTQNLWRDASARLSGKIVGSQYWDNTSCDDRRVPAYFIACLGLTQNFDWHGRWSLRADVGNLFNNRYYAYAWVSRAESDGRWYQWEGLYPQAPANFTISLGYSF